ncbi:trypsin-like serine protease [Amycolatopsis sp. H20-H5]|uniref:trypsin-like serine protease n=1 Tax=Amycolatopsis sp. H20-H5 TaxID=3046309 RepID=UPI002DB8CCB9|nr:trypsin-like serine protease [Amycolatopsis sp. H20-H5]MEC3977559.1 trypsin-like serine protease [Amycolatopsis sp. H20-H5]
MSLFPSAGRVAAVATTLLTAAALLAVPPATAQVQNTRVPLADGASAPAAAHRDATVGGDRGVGIAVALRPHDEAGLNRLVSAVSDPRSPDYRHYLTSEQYNARFAPTASDVTQVTDFLRSQGFQVTSVSGNHQVVDATGSALTVKAAFGTSLGDYTGADGAHFYANDSVPSIPATLSQVVRNVMGLTDRPVAHRASSPVIRRVPGQGDAGPAGPGGPGGGYTPAQFRTAYSMNKLSGSYTGSGQNVGLVEFDAFKQSDLDAWTKNFGQPSVTPKIVPINGGVTKPGNDQLEVTLDVEAVAATAPGAAQTVYEAPNSDAAWVDEMAKIASDNSITILSGSWLNGEKCESAPIKASHDSYTQMAAQGITMLSASGDWGATGCGYQGDNSTVQADFPASDPLFTGVGGTQLRTSDSAGTYQSESCWNQGSSGNTRSGGGYSQIYAKPSWQTGSNQFRSVPDVALDADYGAGALSVYMNGGWQDVGGTSLSSPLWAGYVAMVNQKAKGQGKSPVGAMNPTIYSIAGSSQYSSTFRDVTSGGNGTYNAGTGYDLCTGWGSPQGDNLVDPLINGAAPAPSNDFSLAASPSSVSVDPGKSVTTSVGTTVTKGSAQDVALSADGLPAGVTASFSPETVTAGKSSTLTLTAASSASPGTSPVTVTGKGADVSHTATVSLAVNGSGTGDFSLAVSPSSATVTAGQSATATVSATAVGGSAVTPAARPAVVGGDTTTVEQYPFMISMRREGSAFPGQQSCSMALVGPHTVVGAAHCLLEKDGTKWFIYGATNLNDSGFRADIKDSWTDPDYTSWQTGHDVAVIHLDKDVPVPAGITYPTLATDGSVNAPGTMGRGIGWGKTGQNTYSDVLRTTEFPVAKDSDCAQHVDTSQYYRSDGSMLCTGYADGHKGVCVGDSGSPYLEGNQIVGFFSWMSNACNTYGVYSRVTTYVDEIKAHLGGTPAPGGIALSASGLPAGAAASFDPSSIDPGGSAALTVTTTSATPAGDYTITVTGTNAQKTHTATFALTVKTGSSGPVTVTDPGVQFVHGQPVNLQLRATGGTGVYTWSATGLPPGLSIDAKTGLITGTASTGYFSSPVTATDSGGTSGKVSVGWLVY